MKKLFSLLCMMLLMAQLAIAQQNLYVLSKSGDLTSYPAKKVFFDDDAFSFTFTYGDVTKSSDSFSSSVTVALKSDEYKSMEPVEVGICYAITETPLISDEKIALGTSLGKYSFSVNALIDGTTYYFRSYVTINDVVYYDDVKKITTLAVDKSKTINGYNFVDLGLPSRLLWAETNIGAKLPADDGVYFAWGETSKESGNSYSWSCYDYGRIDNLIKYNSTDLKRHLDATDDAASVNWRLPCRMPTADETDELTNTENCIWTWTSQTNSSGEKIKGFKVTSVRNGNSIFLPASGYYSTGGLYGRDQQGCYWTNQVCWSTYNDNALRLLFSASFTNICAWPRPEGLTVRAVAEP